MDGDRHRYERALRGKLRHDCGHDGLYDFRVVATDTVGNSTSSAAVTNRRVDNPTPQRPRTIQVRTCARA